MNHNFLFASLVFISVFLVSCEADVNLSDITDDIALHPELVFPIGSGSFRLEDALMNNLDYDEIDYSDNSEIRYIRYDSIAFRFTNESYSDSVFASNSQFNSKVSCSYLQTWDYDKYFPDGLIRLSDPRVHVTVSSNVDSYISFQIDSITSFSSTDSAIAPTYAWFNGHTAVSYADQFDSKPLPGSRVTKTLKTLDSEFGEINHLFGTDYDRIKYDFSAWINQALVYKDPVHGFITPDQDLKVYVTTEIPFRLDSGSYYLFRGTIENVFEWISDAFDDYDHAKISSAAVVLNVTNGLPVKADLALSFVDSLGNELSTGFEKNYSIQAGNVDQSGIVQQGNAARQTIIASVNKDQIGELRKAKSIAYSVLFQGKTANSPVHFTKDDFFEIRIGLYVKGDLSAEK